MSSFNITELSDATFAEEIEQYPDGQGILTRLGVGGLNGNGPTGRIFARTDTRMHDHLIGGSGGIAFIYKSDRSGNVTPTVYDVASSRDGNKYKWKRGTKSSGGSDASIG